MRILLVSHLFPPSHSAGVEVFVSELGVALAELGHQVFVFHSNKRPGRRNFSMIRRTYRGLGVFEVINNLFHTEFEQTWSNPDMEARFEEALSEIQPDVVHFHHLMYLSGGALPLAKRHAKAVLFTPHDFFLECAAMGQLVHVDGSVCQKVDTDRCGTCIPHTAWAQGGLQRRVGRRSGRAAQLHPVGFGSPGPAPGAQASPGGPTLASRAQSSANR